jgi:hypothetical protein
LAMAAPIPLEAPVTSAQPSSRGSGIRAASPLHHAAAPRHAKHDRAGGIDEQRRRALAAGEHDPLAGEEGRVTH